MADPEKPKQVPNIDPYHKTRLSDQEVGAVGPFLRYRGLDENLAKQLVELSTDEEDAELGRQTGDQKRFEDQDAYEAWASKGRSMFALVDQSFGTESLAGVIWYGPKDPPFEASEPGTWDTIAFRSYPRYRGQGLMGDFSRFVIKNWIASHEGSRNLWLEVDADNEAGIALYAKLGFEEHSPVHSAGKDRVVMAYKKPAKT